MASPSRRSRRLLTAAVVAGGAVAVTRSLSRELARTRPARDAVSPELRNPMLYLRLEVTNERVLALGRRALVKGRPPVAGVEVSDRVLPAGVGDGAPPRVRVYERPDRDRPSGTLLWVHGGGMIMGTPQQDDQWLSMLADQLGILVVSVDYRLAPENPYPAGLDDCMAALAWVHDAAAELGVDPTRIAVGGASAGGGLAAAVALRARDESGPSLCFQLLNYPMLDDRTVLRRDHRGTGDFLWTPASNRFGWTAYLGGPPSEDDPRVLAAPARATDLAGLPPAWIGVGELDLFHAEDTEYAHRLDAAGVPCELREEPGMYHGADQLMLNAPRMTAYRDAMVDALGRAVARPTVTAG